MKKAKRKKEPVDISFSPDGEMTVTNKRLKPGKVSATLSDESGESVTIIFAEGVTIPDIVQLLSKKTKKSR